jgi:Flp pilus assembly protein TadD
VIDMSHDGLTRAVFAALVLSVSAGCGVLPNGPGGQETLESEALLHIATTAEQNGNYETAINVLRKGIAAHPGDLALQIELGQALYGAGDSGEAIKTFDAAIQAAPARPDAHILLGRLYLTQGKSADALTEFQAVLANDPRHINALNGKGIALDLLNRSGEAQECYRAVLTISPDDRAALNNLGLSLALSGHYDEAIKELSQLVLQPGSTARMRQNLSLAYGLKGDRSQSERIARVDLDEAAAKANLKYFDSVRGLAASASASAPAATVSNLQPPGAPSNTIAAQK